jgi:hypothetical protein
MINLLKETSSGQKQCQRKVLNLREKRKTLTLCSNLELAVGCDVDDDVDVDE